MIIGISQNFHFYTKNILCNIFWKYFLWLCYSVRKCQNVQNWVGGFRGKDGVQLNWIENKKFNPSLCESLTFLLWCHPLNIVLRGSFYPYLSDKVHNRPRPNYLFLFSHIWVQLPYRVKLVNCKDGVVLVSLCEAEYKCVFPLFCLFIYLCKTPTEFSLSPRLSQ